MKGFLIYHDVDDPSIIHFGFTKDAEMQGHEEMKVKNVQELYPDKTNKMQGAYWTMSLNYFYKMDEENRNFVKDVFKKLR